MSQAKRDRVKPTFDREVHVRDRKTGAITLVKPYRMRVLRDGPTTVERDGVIMDTSGKVLSQVSGEALLRTPKSYKVYQNDQELRAAVESETRKAMRAELDGERAAIEADKARLMQERDQLAKDQLNLQAKERASASKGANPTTVQGQGAAPQVTSPQGAKEP